MELVECTVDDTTFNMIVSNEWEQWRIDTLATKEPETVEWILENFRPGDTLFDIGANVGIYAILAAARNPGGTVVAVEPMAANFTRLCENALVNRFTNLRPYCVAVGAEPGVGTLNVASLEAASSMHSIGASGLTGDFGQTVLLQAGIGIVTLDSLAAMAGAPDLVKIDVDGGEDAVLAGAAGVLQNRRLRSLVVEFNSVEGVAYGERDTALRRAGFAPSASGELYHRSAVTWQNTIYTRC
jgi:FkbM family methyltransferase